MKIFKPMTLVMAAILVFAGCSMAKPVETSKTPATESSVESIMEQSSEEMAEEEMSTENSQQEVVDEMKMKFSGMMKNEYPDLEISSAILERKAILPGSAFKVHFNISNNGDKAIAYVKGSGVAVVPNALIIDSKEIQAVLPKEQLGPMTMDFRTEVLEPGESLEFVYHFLAIKPSENFVETAMDYMRDTGEYIGEKDLDIISKMVEGLVPVESGEYMINGYFVYSIIEDAKDLSDISEPTGYAATELKLGVN